MGFDDYLADLGLSDSTAAVYARLQRRWEAEGQEPVEWLRSLPLHEMPARTVNLYRAAVMHALDHQGVDYDPARLRKQTRGRKRQRNYRHALTPDELELYREAVEASSIPEPCWTILRLLPYCGMRVTEACRLPAGALRKVGDVPGLLFHGKGNKERFVPLGKRGRRVLTDWRKVRRARLDGEASPWLFPSPMNPERPVSAETVRAHLRQLRAETELPATLTPHVLRHCYATELLDKGVELRVLQDLLGHASISTTALYARPRVERLAEAVALLDD